MDRLAQPLRSDLNFPGAIPRAAHVADEVFALSGAESAGVLVGRIVGNLHIDTARHTMSRAAAIRELETAS